LRASVGSTEAAWDQSTSVCRTAARPAPAADHALLQSEQAKALHHAINRFRGAFRLPVHRVPS
jgi:hypothetical protein